MKFVVLTLVSVLFFTFQSRASEPYFCEALNSDETYKKNYSYKKLISGNDGWVFRTKTDFSDSFDINEALEERLIRLNRAFEKQGIKVVIALLPTRGMVHHSTINNNQYDENKAVEAYKALSEKMRKTGFSVAAVDDFSNVDEFFYKRDHHWRPEGAKLMALQVAEEVKKLSVYKDIPKIMFKTDEADKIDHKGTFQKFIERTCKADVPAESVSLYKTYATQDGLFGDKPKAGIALIGTSNSTHKTSHANFEGFLKESLGADVENFSVSGGGVDTAMLDWLSSDDYRTHKPKVVVWEIPVYQNFKGESFYRQAIPAVYGQCLNGVVAEEKLLISDNKFQSSTGFKDQNITLQNHYAYLKFDDFKGRKFRLTVEDANSKKYPFDFRRSKFYQPDGVYFLEFNQDVDLDIKTIKGLMPDNSKGSLTMQICQYL